MLGSSTAGPLSPPTPSLNTAHGVEEIAQYTRPMRNDVPGSPGGAQLRGQEVNWFSHRRETESSRRPGSFPPGPVKTLSFLYQVGEAMVKPAGLRALIPPRPPPNPHNSEKCKNH